MNTSSEMPAPGTATAPPFLPSPLPGALLFAGKGGVGKTTCASATAVALASREPGRPYLLVSTDPAHSLSDSLDADATPANLTVLELDAETRLQEFLDRHREHLHLIAARGTFLDDEDISQLLDLSIPGLDEFMAFVEISAHGEGGEYACVVVDTAPTGHTLRLLGIAEVVRGWIEALDVLLGKHRYMMRLYRGRYDPDEVDEMLLDLANSVDRTEAFLRDPHRSRLFPVMLPETLSVQETERLIAELADLEIPVVDVVVNRLVPPLDCGPCTDRRRDQMRTLGEFDPPGKPPTLWGVPEYPDEVTGQEPLGVFWDGATRIDAAEPSAPSSVEYRPWVGAPLSMPTPGTELLLFVGKGGVGKTTLAGATAVHLSRAFEDPTLLISVDPAHSLSDCLGVPVGPEPTPVAPDLRAMATDAEGELRGLKRTYSEEIDSLFAALSPNVDLAFDREVMEHMMDLAPAGLDEVMAITVMIDLLQEREYGRVIVDTAPTGHLLRLLEMPALIEEWLKVFFALLLKYREVLRVPTISDRLIRLSKDLKKLRRLLTDPVRSGLFVVTIPTRMALAETVDLVEACDRIAVPPRGIFVNFVTPTSECPHCSAVTERETAVRDDLTGRFPRFEQAVVHRAGDPVGLNRLASLGRALYRTTAAASPWEAN